MNVFATVALWGFWILLAAGWMLDELTLKAAAIFVLIWIAGLIASSFVLSGTLFLPFVAFLDIALVLAVFKGDVTLK